MDAADINHGVQLTGYANGKNEGWWVVRNSWGDDCTYRSPHHTDPIPACD